MLGKIIKEQGWRAPITVSKRSGYIVKGHGRLEAAFMVDSAVVPVEYQDYESKEAEHADMIADNKIAEFSEMDDAQLQELLDEMKDTDFDLLLTGLDLDEIDNLLTAEFPDFNTFDATEDDYIEEPPENPKSRRGEIYKLGNHRLMCGDSTNAEDVKRLVDGKTVDVLFTSPPYNIGCSVAEHKMGKNSKYLSDNDNRTDEEYTDFLTKFTELGLKHAQFSFINIQMLANNKKSLVDYLHKFKDQIADVMIWDKQMAAPAMAQNVLNSQFEFVFVFSKSATRAIGTKEFKGTLSNVVDIPKQMRNEYSDIHNATFPMDLANHFVKNFSSETVMDLFGGTGTTLMACEQLNRACYMMEYEPKYVDVIIDRWEKHTGKKAELIKS